MIKKLDEFILAIKKGEKPFVYGTPVTVAYLLLSYDESIAELDNADFRPYIIAALHAKGAVDIQSYVASTILFKVESQEGKSWIALANWKKYLIDIFGAEIKIMLCVTLKTTDDKPLFDKVANPSIEAEFISRRDIVLGKFTTLK